MTNHEGRRRARSVAMTDAEWNLVIAAAQAAQRKLGRGYTSQYATPAAWARRALLAAAEEELDDARLDQP